MTFTATFQIGYYPGSPRELFIEDAPVTVEFEADVCVERDPVEVDWPPVVERHVAVDCDMGGVRIESVVLEVNCRDAAHTHWWGAPAAQCPHCQGSLTQLADILPTLSPADLTRLREECAEWAREHAVEQGNS